MGLLGMFSAVSMATGWRLGPVKLSSPSESRPGCAGEGEDPGTKRLIPESTIDLQLSSSALPCGPSLLLSAPPKPPSRLGRASGSQVCFDFSVGNSPRAARRPNLVGAVSAKAVQTARAESYCCCEAPKQRVPTFAQTMTDASTVIYTSEHFQSCLPARPDLLYRGSCGLIRSAVR